MKKYIIIGIAFLLMLIGLTISIKSCSSLRKDKERLENNQDVLIKENTKFKTKDGLNVSKINALTLNLSSTKEYYSNLIKEAEKAGLAAKRVTSITEVGTVTKDTLRIKVRDTIYLKDTLKCFDYKDNFFTINGCLKKDSLSINYSNQDSLIQFVSIVPKKWLFFTWGTKAIQQTIISKNPKTTFIYQKYIEIK